MVNIICVHTYLFKVLHIFFIIGNPSANSEDINEISNEHNSTLNENINGDEWYIPQSDPTETIPLLSSSPKYGFANKISAALVAFEVYILE